MNPDDKRLSMSLDEIIQMRDLKTDSDESNGARNNREETVQQNGTESQCARMVSLDPNSVTRPNTSISLGRAGRPYYNRHSQPQFYQYGERLNFPFNSAPSNPYWNERSYARRFRPYRGRHHHSRSFYNNSYYNNGWPVHRSQENLRWNNGYNLTEERLKSFNRSQMQNGYGDRSRRSGSVHSNRSFASNPSYRSFHSQRSNRSQRSDRSFGSHRSFGSNRSLFSNQSFGSNRSLGSNRSFRSNRSFGSARSFGSNWSNASNKSFRARQRSRPWINGRFPGFRRHRNILNKNIQEDIKKIQENKSVSSKSILHTEAFDFTPRPVTTSISLNERFLNY